MRILHTADIHLGSSSPTGTGPCGLDFGDRASRALKAVVGLSLKVATDLIIVAGDLFDSNQVDAATVDFALNELRGTGVPVVILPGNHDCLLPDSVYVQACFSKRPANIRVFTIEEGQSFQFPDLDLVVWGRPITSYGGDLRPLTNIPPRGEERWHVAVAHGHYTTVEARSMRSFPIYEDDVAKSGQDYVALGHWSAFKCICDGEVKAYYSGSASETGTVAVIDFLDAGVSVEPYSLPLATLG